MSGSKQTDNGHGESSTSGAPAPAPVNIARGVVLATKEEAHERNADHALWLLNSLHVPLAFKDMDNPYYNIIDVISDSPSNRSGGAAGSSSLSSTGSRHPFAHVQHQSRSTPHRADKQSSHSMINTPVDDISLLEESLDRRYKFTEDTVFWTLDNEYNVFFIIDISQSMYSLDPDTNNTYIHAALETLEKCLMGMMQPFSVRSITGLPDYTVEPHICASVVGYCPRPAGSYPVEEGCKKLPFCRTFAHAHMVTIEGIPSFIKSICNFLFNYENEMVDSLGSFPPPAPPIPLDIPLEPSIADAKQRSKRPRHARKGQGGQSFEPLSASGKAPRPGDTYTFAYDPDAPLLNMLQIADYFLKIMPEVCSPAFVCLTDGVAKSHFAVSKAQEITSSLVRRNTRCTFVQVGSRGGYTPETTFGYVSDNELLFYMAASLNGRFIYASDCPDTVLPHQANFYHQVMLIRETRIARTPVRHRYDHVFHGGRRLGDFPRERLNINKDCGLQATHGGDPGFPWCADSRPPSVETVTARYTDYSMPVNMGTLIEARMNEGFSIRSIQVARFDRDGLVERVDLNLELVWHPNVTVVYRIKNVYHMALDKIPKHDEKVGGEDDSQRSPSTPLSPSGSVSGSGSGADSGSRSVSEGFEGYVSSPNDRSQRGPNMVEIMIRAYNMFTLVFLRPDYNDKSKGGIFLKVAMLHDFLKSIDNKDKRLRQIYSSDLGALSSQQRIQPPVFAPPVIETISDPLPVVNETIPLASRILIEEVDPNVFLSYTDWGSDHFRVYDTLNQLSKIDSDFKPLASFSHVTSMFIDPDLILSFVDGINFIEAAKHGQRIMNEFRAHVCQAGTWALLGDQSLSVVFLRSTLQQSHQTPAFIVVRWEMATNWILRVSFFLYNGTVDARKIVMDCLPTFTESFRPDYRDPSRESVVRATRPLHLLPMDLDIVEKVPSNLLSTRDIGDVHTYVVEWRWTYLAREGKHEDLSGEGSDSEIVRQALHRLALTLGYHRLGQDFTLVNAKGESTGLIHGPDASMYDSCITFFHEREGYDVEELLLACQYQIIVDMKQSSVSARTWIEPWSSRFIRMLFEDDFRLLAPLGTFQQILQPERCFQLKVPNIAEFHSRRMNMFSIMAVVNSSRIALRMLQLPDISPGYAVWNHPDGSDNIKVDDPTFEITREHDPDEDLEVHILDENGKSIEKVKATEYYKTHGREETRELIKQRKVSVSHVGSKNGERRAILLERFMLTLFEKNDEGKYDPHIEKYRLNEYNPFILAMINPGHPRKLFFNKLTTKWMTTGEFTTVAHRCFLEFALFKHCNAISVNAERFNNLRFASSIVNEMMDLIPGMNQATGIPNGLDEHLYMDKWFVIRLPNNSSFLMVILPNVALSAPNRQLQESGFSESTKQPGESSTSEESGADNDKQDESNDEGASQPSSAKTSSSSKSKDSSSHKRKISEPAIPPVFTPALEQSILGDKAPSVEGAMSTSINSYTLVMECSMDHTEMRRQVRSMDGRSQIAIKSKLNLRPLDVICDDTMVHGGCFQGFVGQKDIPIPFTDYALEEIKILERMYSEANLQTIYLALLLKREVSELDLISCQQSTLWKKQSIDVDITAFLHSQDVARISRDIQWQDEDRQSLQETFMHLLCESFTPLPIDVDPSQGRYYYCKTTPDKRSELEVCLQLALNPLFVNLQCSVEVLDGDIGYEKRLNMPIDSLPLSLELLCEQANIPWRPPTDHFEPLKGVRVILHINCMYLSNEDSTKPDSDGAGAEVESEEQTKIIQPKPDKHELESRSEQLFQKTMSLSSLVHESFDPVTLVSKNGVTDGDSDLLPSAVVAKQHINAQMATLKGLPHDQLELVRHCHRRFVRFIAQETLYALRDVKSVTVPLLNQVWHTIATTVDDDVPLDRFEFSQNKLDLNFVINMPDAAKRGNAVRLVMTELLKQDNLPTSHPLGRLESLGDVVYMRDVRSRSARIEAGARIRARAKSDAQSGVVSTDSNDSKEIADSSTEDLTDAIPSWFLIKPTSGLDGVRILTHNYSIVTSEAAENVLAVTRQRLMVALKAANTRLLLEEMADSHRFPDLLIPPDSSRFDMLSRTGSTRTVGQTPDTTYAMRDEGLLATAKRVISDGQASLAQNTDGDTNAQRGNVFTDTYVPSSVSMGGASGGYHGQPSSKNLFNIASILKPYIPDNPEFYSCEEQFKHAFPLHPRIHADRAVQAVLSGGMMNNRLVNQRNMFFVRDGSSIFYALLAIDRIPYVNPFGLGGPGKGPKTTGSLSSMPGQTSTFATPMYSSEAILPGAHTIATTSPNPNVYEPFRSESRVLVDPLSFPDLGTSGPPTLQTAQLGSRGKDEMRRRSPFVQPANAERGGSAVFGSTSFAANNDGVFSASIDRTQPSSPRLGSADNALRVNSRYSLSEAVTSYQSVAATPESPSSRNMLSSLTNLDDPGAPAGSSRRLTEAGRSPGLQNSVRLQTQSAIHLSQASAAGSPLDGNDRQLPEALTAEPGTSGAYSPAGTVGVTSRGSQLLSAGRVGQFVSGTFTPSSEAPVHAEEKAVPCIILYLHGVDKPRKEMTQSLVQKIRERITLHVTMPEMSDMLLRRVALNVHDMDFLFPACNPEPVILYMPLPKLVHDVDRLMMYFRQAMGNVISPFPHSDMLSRAIWRTFAHLRRHHSSEDVADDGMGVGTRVPRVLKDDISRVMEGWENDGQIPVRIPLDKLVFLYNYHTMGGAPPQEMTDIGAGVAVAAALPLTKDRILPRGIWEDLVLSQDSSAQHGPPAGGDHSGSHQGMQGHDADDALTMPSGSGRRASQSSAHRRAASYFMDVVSSTMGPVSSQAAAPLSSGQQSAKIFQRRSSHTPSPHEQRQLPQSSHSSSASLHLDSEGSLVTGDSPNLPSQDNSGGIKASESDTARTISGPEIAGLFGEYLRQCKAARTHLRLDASEFSNVTELVEKQVDEFKGEQVVAIILWSNASVRLDRMLAYVSRLYWNALGDYVSENILHPILYAGWGDLADPVVKVPDPFASLESCSNAAAFAQGAAKPKYVLVPLYSVDSNERLAAQARLAMLRTKESKALRAPSTFTETTKMQMHAMEIARQMAQYWGRQETVQSMLYHQQKLPRVTGISHWFSDELYDMLQTICPSMHPARFRLLENPLVLNSTDREIGDRPKPLFPAHSLRKSSQNDNSNVVYDLSALPKVLKGTRQSFCIMCTLPLEELASQQLQRPGSSSYRGEKPHSSSLGSTATVSYAQARRVDSLRRHNPALSHQRVSTRSSLSAGSGQPLVHGLGLQGLAQGDGGQTTSPHLHNHPKAHQRQQHLYGGSQKHSYGRAADAGQLGRRPHRLPAISERRSTSAGPKNMPPPSDYKSIADPETPVLGVDEITHYPLSVTTDRASNIAWLVVWLIGGELEMVGYNVSQRLWENVCDQIKQRLERESRRNQLLGMFASHMVGIFPGFDRKAQHKGISSTWLDRNVTRDLINKFALQKQVAMDDQIHYFNIERHLSGFYRNILGAYDGSEDLEKILANPPVADMTLNDMKNELVLRQLQPEHLRWARKLTFVDYTQPYVDTRHPDTLFRIGSRFMRSYQGRIWNVLRYDELMRIADQWRNMAVLNGLNASIYGSSRLLSTGMHTESAHLSSQEGFGSGSGSNVSISQVSGTLVRVTGAAAKQTSSTQANARAQAPARSDRREEEIAADKGIGAATATEAASIPTASGEKRSSEISLDNMKMVMESARLLHFVCAPIPISRSIKPAGTDLQAFKRLFYVISAMLQNLADNYIDYLCSTGYAIAKRYEKECPWNRALEGLGYPPDKVSSITKAFIGKSTATFAPSRHAESSNTSLPSVMIPCAYLFANTERSNLVTEMEVNLETLSIRVYALGRFTPGWRSSVPGYVRSTVNQHSIKNFTFELSKFKKLLHAKSFVYDFQLRYVAYLLKPADSISACLYTMAQQANAGGEDGLEDEFYKHNTALYSSESESESAYDSSKSTDSDHEEAAYPGGSTARPRNLGPAESHGRGKRKVVAQVLHVHIDLAVFFGILSQQRYYSTRFSSRRLVRSRFPVMNREMYEYFSNHSGHYYFYNEGCKPPIQGSVDSPLSDRVPAADLCTDLASHSGCYRLYDGMFSETMDPRAFGSDMGSDSDSFVWPPVPGDRTLYFHSGSHGHKSTGGVLGSVPIASSAPAPASRMDHAGGRSSDADHGKQPHLHPFNSKGRGHHLYMGTDLARTQSYTTSTHSHHGDRGKQAAWPVAAGSMAAHSGAYVSSKSRGKNLGHDMTQIGTAGYPTVPSFSPSPLYNSRSAGHSTKDGGHHGQQTRVPAWGDSTSGPKSLDQEAGEYSLCKIHMTSNDTSVRVSLMALAPDCDVCHDEDRLETQRRKERQQSHSEILGERAAKADKKTEHRQRHHHHHRRHQDHDNNGGQMHSGSRSESRQQQNSSSRAEQSKGPHAIDNVSDLFNLQKGKSSLSIAHKSPSYHPHIASVAATNITAPRQSISKAGGAGGGGFTGQPYHHAHDKHMRPFQRWMDSLASDIITDPEMDGLCDQQTAGDSKCQIHAQSSTVHGLAQLSYYLIVDMDPQTTLGLSNLCAIEARSRNGSLGQLPDCLSDTPGSADDKMSVYGMRQCSSCSRLSREAGKAKLCTTHKILSLVRVDMRDWENKGDVWASEPTMVMEVSNIDPNEYDKEDPDVLHWIKKTARRIIKHVAMDYHRDINWYRICQHLRMADLPASLDPSDVLELVGFVERQGWEDVGAHDEEAQQLLSLDISATRVIRLLQLRMRRFYLEPSLLMTSMCACPVPKRTCTERACGQDSGSNQVQLAATVPAASGSGAVATPPSSPVVGINQFSHSRHSTVDRSGAAYAEARQDAIAGGHVNTHTLPWNPLCPVAAIDSHGRIVPGRSSDNINEVLQLLSPLELSINRRTLLDPAFQKVLGRYVQFDIVASPWLCKRHRHTTSAPIYKWSLNGSPVTDAGEDDNRAERDGQFGSSSVRDAAAALRKPDLFSYSMNKRLQQVQESDGLTPSLGSGSDSRRRSQDSGGGRISRAGASISSLIGLEPPAPSLSTQPQGTADHMHSHSYSSTMNRRVEALGGTASGLADAGAASSASIAGLGSATAGAPAAAPDDYFLRPLVEALPGSLLVVDPDSDEYAARLLLLNPFSCHSMLELLFERRDGGKGVRLGQIRTVSRDRRRNGLYEHERKQVNMVLSTVSAVAWDVLTQSNAAS